MIELYTFSGTNENLRQYTQMTGKSSTDFSDLKRKMHGSKNEGGTMKVSLFESSDEIVRHDGVAANCY